MLVPAVAAFTDTYLPTVNGVTYTVSTWREHWRERDGRMAVVYPDSSHRARPDEHPVTSVAFPFYDGFRAGLPFVPDLGDVDLVHAHTPFLLGLAARRFARSRDVPLVASYHTPTAEYADYLPAGPLSRLVERVAGGYERWYLNRTDAVIVPSAPAREHLEDLGVTTDITVVPNGVDTDFFAPDPEGAERLREEYGLEGPIVGYTGRHGFEKELEDVVEAVDGMDVTVVFGGDGPAREPLEQLAREKQRAGTPTDYEFLGFLDREKLPAFYSMLDVFAFPSPVETQGLVALEANACGTPVVGVDSGALVETVEIDETGYRYERGDTGAFREQLERALDARERLSESCLDSRERISVEHAVDTLQAVYEQELRR